MEGCDREKVSNMVVQYAGHFPGVCVYPTALLWDYISKKSENPSDEAIDNRIIVDVREDAEMKVSVIPFSISRREFESDVMPSLDKNTLIIPYCTIGYRSAKYAEYLKKEHHFTNAQTGEGVVAWTYHADYLIDRSTGQRTNRVHTFGSAWDYVSPKFTSVQFTLWETVIRSVSNYFKSSG